MNASSLHNLKQSRIVIVDDDFDYLTRCAEALWRDGYLNCTPVAVFPSVIVAFKPRSALTPEELSQEARKLSDELKSAIQGQFSGMTEQEEYSKKIVPANVQSIVPSCKIVQPHLIILDTALGQSKGYNLTKSIRKEIPNAKLIGSSGDPDYRRQWAQEGADAFFHKDDYSHDQSGDLIRLVDVVLKDLPEAKKTLEGRIGGW